MSNEKETNKIVMNAYNPVNLPVPEGFDLNQLISEYTERDNPERKYKYMPASARIAWFRGNEPDSPMPVTELISDSNGIVLFKASLYDKEGNIRATAIGTDSFENHPNEVYKAYETAETKAIGRCLRFLGYGIGIKDEGDEKEPIDQPAPDRPIKSINEMIDDDTETNKKSETDPSVKTFADMTDVEKGVAAIFAPFPIKFVISGSDYKNEPLYKIMSALKKAGTNNNPAEDIQKKLNWGLENNMKGMMNSKINLAYPEYATFVISMLNDLELYNKVAREAKTQLNTKQENAA